MENIEIKTGDLILRATGKKAELRFLAMDLTQTANEIVKTHGAEAWTASLLADSAAAALFIASGIKFQGSIRLEAEFSGDISKVVAEATPLGLVRAKMNQEEIVSSSDFELMLSPQVLRIKKFDQYGKMLSEGIVPMESQFMGKNLAAYFLQSEQIRSGVSIFTKFNPEKPSEILYSVGYLVEAFPKADDKTLIIMEEVIKNLGKFDDFYDSQKGFDLRRLLDELCGPFDYEIHREVPVVHFVNDDPEAMYAALRALGSKELQTLIDVGEDIEMCDDYSRKTLTIPLEKLIEIKNSLEERP